MSENIERPPLGVKPRYLAAEERYHELLNVISASWPRVMSRTPNGWRKLGKCANRRP